MTRTQLSRTIDRYIGGILCIMALPLRLLRPSEIPLSPRRIAFVKLWAIGESIVTLPLIHALHMRFPHAEITVISRSQNKDVFTGHQWISHIETVRLGEIFRLLKHYSKYDIVFDLEPYFNLSALLSLWFGKTSIGFSHGIRSVLYTKKEPYDDQHHVVQAYMNLTKAAKAMREYSSLIPIAFSTEDRSVVENLLSKQGVLPDAPRIAIAPGSGGSAQSRRWPWERYNELVQRLAAKSPATFIIVGDVRERALAEKIGPRPRTVSLAGKITLKQLAYFFTTCSLVIANDSGPMHLAAAQSTPTLGLFGPNTPVRFAPYGPANRFIYKGTTPAINVHKGQIPEDDPSRAMERISVDEVEAVATNILSIKTRHQRPAV